MKTILLTLLTLLTLSCTKSEQPILLQPPHAVTPILVGKGTLFHNPNSLVLNEQYSVITDNAAWTALLEKINSWDLMIGSMGDTTVDFTTDEVIFAIEAKNSGTTVDIFEVFESSSTIYVTVLNLQKSLVSDVALPFHIVKIPKSTKPVVFN